MNCSNCGRFMTKQAVTEDEIDPCIYQWWSCKCGHEYPQVIWDRAMPWNKPHLMIGVFKEKTSCKSDTRRMKKQ